MKAAPPVKVDRQLLCRNEEADRFVKRGRRAEPDGQYRCQQRRRLTCANSAPGMSTTAVESVDFPFYATVLVDG